MKPFKTHINENSFYTIQSEKEDFVNNDKLVINAFFFSFIGFLGLLDGAKDNQKIKMYFKSDKKSRVTEITDENNDTSLIIKIMSDKGFFKNPTVVNQITKFLVKVKTGQIDSVDENIVRGWIDEIKPDKLTNLSAVLKKLLQNFRDGGSLASFADDLKSNAKITRWKTTEFSELAKITKIDPAKKKAPSAVSSTPAVAAATKPSDANTTTVATTAATKPSDANTTTVATTAATPTASKKVKAIRPFNANEILDGFRSGSSADDVTSGMKINDSNRSELLKKMIAGWPYDWMGYEKEWQTALDYLKWHRVNQNVLQNEIFSDIRVGSGYSAQQRAVKNIKKLLDSNIFSLFEKSTATKSVIEVVKRLMDDIINEATDLDTLEKLNSYKKSVSSFVNSPIALANYKPAYNIRSTVIYYFLADKSQSDLIKDSGRYFLKNSDGTYSIDYQGLLPVIRLILPLFNITQASGGAAVAKTITDQYRIDWKDFSKEELISFYDYLKNIMKSEPKLYQQIVLKVLKSLGNSVIGNAITPGDEWNDIITLSAETVIIPDFIKAVTTRYSPLDFNKIPPKTGMIIAKRIGEYLKTNSLSDDIDNGPAEVLDKLAKLAKILTDFKLIDQYKKYIGDEYVTLTKKIHEQKRYMYFQWDRAVPNDVNTFIAYISKQQQDDIDKTAINRVLNIPDTGISGPVSFYSNMSAENQKAILKIVNDNSSFSKVKHILDSKLLNDIDPKDFVENFGNLAMLNYGFDTSEFLDKILALPEGKKLIDKTLNNPKGKYDSRLLLIKLSKSKIINEIEMSKYVDKFFTDLKTGDYYHMASMMDKLDTETFGKKEKIIFEKTISFADQNIKKLTTEYRDFMTSAQPAFIDYINKDRASAEKLYWTMTTSMKRRMAAAYMSNKEFSSSITDAISKGVIAPYEKLTEKRVKEILKYNNVVSEETKISDKYIRDFAAMDAYIKSANKIKPLEDLQIKEIEATPKELAQKSADLHRTKRSNKHTPNGLIIKRSFDVAIPMQVKAHKEWIEKNPDQEIINPMYHGTGSIAASMILRYGFRVIKRGDALVVARMLGDGIYGAINIDKSQQYVGDGGYSKGSGQRGYIFEADVALGEKDKDYKVMGLGNDNIRSPEWCVFTPNAQFMIFKAHEVEIVSPSTMDKILRENPPSVKVDENNKPIRFKSFLKEYVMDTDAVENYTTFTFVNGLIPMSSKGGDYIDFEQFKSPNPNKITLEPSAYGPSIVVRGTERHNDYLFTGPTDMIENYPEVFQEYLGYLIKSQ